MRWISILIFLVLVSFAFGDVNCLVGGSSSDAAHAGWYNPDEATAAHSHDGNGADWFTATGVVMREGGSGFVQIDIPDGTASANWIGVYANFTNSNGSEAAGRNRIAIVDTSGDPDTIDIYPLEWINGTTCDIVIGGAVPATYNAVAYDLEDVLDSAIGSAAAQDVDILIYLAAAQEITEEILIDSNGGSGQYRKRLIGCDSSYAALAVGSYAEYIDTDDNAAGDIFQISVANITFENIAATNPGGNVAQPEGGESCFQMPAGSTGFIARNCRAINGYHGFYCSANNSVLIDCVAYDSRAAHATFVGHGCTIMGGYYETDRNKSYSTTNALVSNGLGSRIIGSTVVGAATGLSLANYGQVVLNCTFKDQTVRAITLNDASSTLIVFNNIFKLADVDNDFEVTLTSGSMYSDHNMSNVITANTRLTGANDVANLTGMSDMSPWVNAAKFTDDYKLDRDDPLVAYAFEAGWSPSSIAGVQGANSKGSYPLFDLPAKTSVVAPDTVYGIEGTSAGNGGLGAGITTKSGGKQ